MRIVIQIPCLNEETTIASVIRDIRAAMALYDDVMVLVVDDGSTDGTVAAAIAAGADYIASHRHNRGLAHAFMTGLAASLNLGADIVVNTDADNQYRASSIPDLIRPVVEGRSDMVIGERPIEDIEHFSALKKILQRLGSRVVRMLSGTSVRDATSGFRALSRDAATRLNSFSGYTYTLETLIQAGRGDFRVASVDIEVNPPTRTSRLIRSIPQYIRRSTADMLRIFTIYAPFRVFGIAGLMPLTCSVLLGLRYLFLITFVDPTRSHAPSLILAAILAGLGFILFATGILGELVSINRRLLESLRVEQRREMAAKGVLIGRCDFDLIRTDHERPL